MDQHEDGKPSSDTSPPANDASGPHATDSASDPIESLAEGLLVGVRDAMDSMFYQTQALARMIDEHAVDGVVFHPIKSCRTVSTGLADNRRALMALRDTPSLYIESDMMDKRVVSEAQLKNRIDAFFEGLRSRRLQLAAVR